MNCNAIYLIASGSESGDDDSGEDGMTLSPEPEDATPCDDLTSRPRPSSALAVSVSNTQELGARRVMSARPRANTGKSKIIATKCLYGK